MMMHSDMAAADAGAGVDFTLVVACYNEEGHVRESVDEVCRVLDRSPYRYEILFIDDCSRDATAAIIRSLVAARPGTFRAIFNEQNLGRGATVTKGIRNARGRWAGFIDIDLEVGAHYIPYCLVSLEEGADVVCGLRIYKFKICNIVRYVVSRGYSRLVRAVLKLPYQDTETGFKFFQREKILPVLDNVRAAGWFWDTEIMARAYTGRLRVVEKPCLFIRRPDKKTTVRVFRDTIGYLSALLAFRIFTWPRLVRQARVQRAE